MVFIKGAWVDLRPWDDEYTKYYCCPEGHLSVHHRKNPPKIFPCWVKEAHCNLLHDRYIADFPEDCYESIIRPDWCPLKVSK